MPSAELIGRRQRRPAKRRISEPRRRAATLVAVRCNVGLGRASTKPPDAHATVCHYRSAMHWQGFEKDDISVATVVGIALE
jgi:hypothetical protein